MAKKKKEPSPRRGRMRGLAANGQTVPAPGAGAAAPAVFDAEGVASELKMFWKSGAGDSFVMQGDDARWSVWPQQATVDAMRAIPGRKVAIKVREDEMLSEVKRVFLWVRRNRCLDEIFPALPGYMAGVHGLPTGEQVLVKTEPRLVTPKAGEWENIRALVDGRLDLSHSGGINQSPWFHSWCKVAFNALVNGSPGQWSQGHAMILAGPPGCGKNRLQEQLITGLLGGRYADPAEFLFGNDDFNADVFTAEHLLLSEIPLPSQRMVDRNTFMERIKKVVANAMQRMRLMRTEPWTVFPFWRLTISVNDDQDSLRMLPLIVPGYGDKVLMFQCRQAPLGPLSPGTDEGSRRRWREAIAEELPAYAHWLVNEWEIPAELVEDFEDGRSASRFGFREFHHPVLKGELFEDTPSAQLLGLIDLVEFSGGPVPCVEGAKLWDLPSHDPQAATRTRSRGLWWERADLLQQLLTGDAGYGSSVAVLAKKIFQHNSCSRLLARLAVEPATAERVAKGDTKLWKGWKIARPALG